MKRLLALLACVASLAVAAPLAPVTDKTITLSFDKVSVVSLVNVAYGDMLKVNFAIHPDLVNFPKLVTVHFQGEFDQRKLSLFLVDLLAGVGVVVEQKPGYVFLRPAAEKKELEPEIEQEIFFYRSKYRPVGFLQDLTASLFKHGRFSTQRGIKGADALASKSAIVVPVKGVQSGGQGKEKQTQDSGNSAFSQIDKTESDSLLFQGTEKEIATLQKLLVQIDTPVPEVVVKGMVYEVTTGAKDGSALSLALTLVSGKFGITMGQSMQGDSISFRTPNIEAVFSALATDSRFKSVSNPSLRVRSGASARFSVGSDVPVLGVAELDKNGNAIQSVEYRPSGVIFDIKPLIRDNVIDLAISQQLSTFVPTTTGVNNSPTLIKREISTSVGAVDGDVIVLGGLDEDRATNDRSGLPFLPDWAKSRGGESSKTQILLVLQVQKL